MTNKWTLTHLLPIVQFEQARPEAISAYTTALENNRISVTLRRSRGKDIDAACGQLANKKNEFTNCQDV